MGKAVQHPGTRTEPGNRAPVFLLVEEETRLLSVFDVDDIAHTVLCDRNECVKRPADETLDPGKTLFFTYLGVTALIDSADRDSVFGKYFFERGEDQGFEPVDPQSQGFHDEHILIFIDGDSGQKISFPENHTAGRGVDYFFSVFPCTAHALLQKGGGDALFFFSAQHPDRDRGSPVDEAPSEKISVKIFHRQNIAVLRITVYAVNFIVINPQPPGLEGAGTAFLYFGGSAAGKVCVHFFICLFQDVCHRIIPPVRSSNLSIIIQVRSFWQA